MRIIDCEQGSREWHEARCGVPTASNFNKILTPGGKVSSSATGYICDLLAERHCREFDDDLSDRPLVGRGSDLEGQAVAFYEFVRGVSTEKVGFCLHDTLEIGASPDRLIGEDGGMEIKVPAAGNHVAYMIGAKNDAYRWQIQGGLWITGRKWWDFLSYHPTMKPAIVRFERDEEYIAKLEAAAQVFLAQYREAQEKFDSIMARGRLMGS